jgi:hypothetical protein
MQGHLLPGWADNEAMSLTRALRDPGVERLALSLGLDLGDPDTLNKLISMSQQHLQASSGLDPDHKQAIARALAPIQSPYARAAVRAYRDMASMR